jgi:hypothetical protein
MVRTQLYIDEALHERLRDLAVKQDRTISELVRDALVRAYGQTDTATRLKTLKAIEGIWRDREDLGATDEFVRRLRRDTRRSRPRT